MTKFLLKGSLSLGLVLLAGALFFDRYGIGIDKQVVKCLPYTVYLFDKKDQDIQKGDYFVYIADGMEPVIADGRRAVKKAAAVAGDRVSVSPEITTVNGEEWENGQLMDPKNVDLDQESLTRTITLQEGEIFAMGTLTTSYDSRYIGPIQSSQVRARAIPIW